MTTLTLKAHVNSLQEQTRGGTKVYLVRFTVDADPGNACPSGQEGLCAISLALPKATCDGLDIGQVVNVTLTPST